MVKFTADEMRRIMDKKHNIRNMSVIAHVDHGKSTLTDSLVAAAGIIAQEAAGDMRMTDTRADEAERGITIKSTGISLHYEMSEEALKEYHGQRDGNEYLINLVDSPGHVDFSSEVTAALRITDGALVVIDCVEGVRVQTETVLRQALAERIKPVLVVNKMDRLFLELQLEGEQAYQTLQRVIENANVVMATYEDPLLGDVQVTPEAGTIAFAAGKDGWAFTLPTFARMWARKFKVDEHKMLKKLWGENFFDSATKKWSTTRTDSPTCHRGFVHFVYNPIKELIASALHHETEHLLALLEKYNAPLKTADVIDLEGRPLMKKAMQSFLPASTALLEMMIFHLPSPATAQKYRVENLYEGPMDDPYANAIRNCDPEGPLMLYVSKMIPASEKGRFLAFGRVFSGRISTGMKVRIMGPNYTPGQKSDLYTKTVQRTVIWMGKRLESVDDVPCGNTVALVGLDNAITKNATVTNERDSDAHTIRAMRFSVSPVVRVAVQCKVPSDLPKLVEGLKRMAKADPMVEYSHGETGEYVVSGAGELHLEICLHDLQHDYMGGAEIVVSEPLVSFRETVTSRSSHTVMTKSANKHNRLYFEARPLEPGLPEAIDANRITRDDPKSRAKSLVEEFNWEKEIAKKIWCFGPDATGANVLVDMTKGVQYLTESRDSIVSAFQAVTRDGALAGENLRGVAFEIEDIVVHSDSVHRNGRQLIPAAKRVMWASELAASPRLMEPVYLVEVQAPEGALGGIYNVVTQRRGEVFEEVRRVGMPLCNVKAYVPVAESFGFAAALRRETSGQAFPQSVFDHWQVMGSDPTDCGSPAGRIVGGIRRRKGLAERVPSLSEFEDRL